MSNTLVRCVGRSAIVLAVMLVVPATPRAADIGTGFTYQGYLSNGGVPATDVHDFRFTMYDASSGGTAIGSTIDLDNVAVSSGVFNVQLDFGLAALAAAQARWLQVEVRPGASTGVYTILPRQKINPAPYAIGLSLPHFQIMDSATPLFSMNNLGTGTAGEFGTISGAYAVGGRTWSTTFQAAGVYGEANGASGNTIGVHGVATASDDGTGIVGTGKKTGAYISAIGDNSTGVYAIGTYRGLYAQNSATGSAIVAEGQGATSYATVWAGNTGTGPALFATGQGGGADNATMKIENTKASDGMAAYVTNVSGYATAHFKNSGTGQVLWLERPSTSAGDFIRCVNATSSPFWVDYAGVTHTKVLEILGGSDLSEKFDVRADGATIEPGTVVSIDAGHEGRLTMSREPYDHRVAGIVSGAGGVQTGMLMGQQGSLADGAHAVALTGRVYCRASAANGPIRPGDLLTTSSVPGHAMRVGDPARAQGAILGKAMGSLEKGEGLVLVLVGLQ